MQIVTHKMHSKSEIWMHRKFRNQRVVRKKRYNFNKLILIYLLWIK